jgi:branched-chain amino acid transport system ATP-binding protein
MALLEVTELSVSYGSVEAVRGLSFSVDEGSLVSLIGSNGAGKSSTLNAVSGLVRPRSGSIRFAGKDITGRRPDLVVREGLAQVPEGRAILGPLTVQENLDLGAWTVRNQQVREEARDRVFALFPKLRERRWQLAGSLSGGEQQMLAIGRALMSRPRLLLLDEPSMGLAPVLAAGVFRILQDIHASGTTVLLVEQNARQALRISQRAIVLSHGQLLREGASGSLLADPVIIEAFLGTGDSSLSRR